MVSVIISEFNNATLHNMEIRYQETLSTAIISRISRSSLAYSIQIIVEHHIIRYRCRKTS